MPRTTGCRQHVKATSPFWSRWIPIADLRHNGCFASWRALRVLETEPIRAAAMDREEDRPTFCEQQSAGDSGSWSLADVARANQLHTEEFQLITPLGAGRSMVDLADALVIRRTVRVGGLVRSDVRGSGR